MLHLSISSTMKNLMTVCCTGKHSCVMLASKHPCFVYWHSSTTAVYSNHCVANVRSCLRKKELLTRRAVLDFCPVTHCAIIVPSPCASVLSVHPWDLLPTHSQTPSMQRETQPRQHAGWSRHACCRSFSDNGPGPSRG